MKKRSLILNFALGFAALTFCLPMFAHHGSAAYDLSKPVVLKGTIKEFDWANPHCLIMFDVQDDKGNAVHWAGEVGSPSALGGHGWSRSSLHPGDPVTVYIFQAKSGAPVGRISKVVLTDGKELYDSATGARTKEQ